MNTGFCETAAVRLIPARSGPWATRFDSSGSGQPASASDQSVEILGSAPSESSASSNFDSRASLARLRS